MKQLYHVFPGVIPSTSCNEIIRRGLLLPSQEASIGFNNDHLDNSYRKSIIRWFFHREHSDIVQLMMSYAFEANREFFGFDIFPTTWDLQFTEYHANNNGKYDWHHDVWWTSPRYHDRKLSMILQLTDRNSYTGGNFEFDLPEINNNELEPFKTQGSILIFPSFFRHRVTPVTGGIRYSLVTWVEGPKFR